MTFAPEGEEFILKDGKRLNGLHMLKDELAEMPDDVFSHHVTSDRNDFAQWVQDSVKEIELAGRMRKAKNKFHMRHIIHKHLEEKDKSIFDSWSDSVHDVLSNLDVQKTFSLKFKVWMGIFVFVSFSALLLFFSMLF
ncbi:hypothetical protein DRJ25_03020 [Candidatus Woesearchaeota archaeon]|nr:MAG: hypothetical protein DRJ25_03020 [Candidatus Woesearchaeota archaeon]